MRQSIDLTGDRYGKLTVLGKDNKRTKIDNRGKQVNYWLCKCDCGEIESVSIGSIRRKTNNKTKCNKCSRKELYKKRRKGFIIETANRHHPAYKMWKSIRSRVKSQKAYKNKNIQVCKEWDDFWNFAKWYDNQEIPENPEIDRIDNNGNYEPSNCQILSHDEHLIKTGLEHRKANPRTNTGIKYITRRKDGYYQVTGVNKKYIGRAKTIEEAIKIKGETNE